MGDHPEGATGSASPSGNSAARERRPAIFNTAQDELHRRNSAWFRLYTLPCAAVVVEGAIMTLMQHGATTMLAFGLLLNIAGIGVLCWLVFTLAV